MASKKRAAMTSKQRVMTAFAHQEVDRVPINYLSNTEIDHRLKEHFGLAHTDSEGLRQRLNVDFRQVGARYVGPKLHPDVPNMQVDEWGKHRRWVEHVSGGYWDYALWPLKDATLEQVEAFPLPSPDNYDYSRIAPATGEWGEYFVMVGGAGEGDIINQTSMLRTMEQVLVDLMLDDPAGMRLIDRVLDVKLEVLRRALTAAKGRINGLWMGEDLGTQRGPIISLDLFRQQIRPRLERFVDLGKEFDCLVMVHSCGSSSWAFEDFIEMGVDVVDTLQPEAANMEPADLKRRFGGRLAFHGMISTAGPVATGTPAQVTESVRQTLEIMMPGGGYALAPTHQIQSNSPVENVLAMYEAAIKFGRYA